jgi:uncharacterized protein
MHLTTAEIFPKLDELIPAHRFARVTSAISGLLERTLTYLEDGSPFIITGDIPAMWLRDSTWQVRPLLQSTHPDVVELLIGLSKNQVRLFLIDPYANAFNPTANGNCWHKDFSDQSPWVFERKFELDSWCSILFLARMIRERYGRTDHINAEFHKALKLMIELACIEQNHDPSRYIFKRENGVLHDSLSHEGRGAPVAYTGMVYSAFRPSDDACMYGYLIPSNLFFVNELENLADDLKTSELIDLAEDISRGVSEFGVVNGILAYEVDGLGNRLFMDDANVPSLLSLPYLGCMAQEDPIYQSTRFSILSESNPYYFSGIKAHGIGSQHTPIGHVWPIAIAVEAMTQSNLDVKKSALELLERTDAATGFMHESFHVNDDHQFTRPWFSWADMTYVQLVLDSAEY